MTVEVKRYDINAAPDSGRPRIVTFTSDAGQLAVHCCRESGALWMFAIGPAGGDRGKVVFGLSRAADVLAWVEDPERRASVLYSLHGWMTIREKAERGDVLTVGQSGWARQWHMPLDDAARDEMLLCMRQWATAVLAETEREAEPA